MDETGQNEAAAAAARRPLAITIVCVIMALGGVATAALFFVDVTYTIAPWYPALLAVSALVGLTCMIGFWLMRKWAVFLYTGMTALVQLVLAATGLWSPFAIIGPAIVVGVGFVYLGRMR
jgi:hypothetical protein